VVTNANDQQWKICDSESAGRVWSVYSGDITVDIATQG